ncbi:MAG TPA: cysteine--tRNA ligase [Spirochaetota bacterium]|nr:cysteine--tRNA ligase [Spirochaetota bacterium]HPJ34958.1 cysteine--tRNA ligase [Spirochaetota bacterium]
MTLKIYNTMSRKVEELIPGGAHKDNISDYPPVTIYSCGPTVYSFAHIGNFRTFIFNDLLRRYLKFRGYKVDHAMNITDVDDKTINGSINEGVTLKEYTDKYTEIFFEDLKTLNIEPVEHHPKATESIDDMISILMRIDEKGILYSREGSLYFNIAKFRQYGKLSCLDSRETKAGARYDADEYDKDDVRDFALWKAPKENEPYWETPYGPGRPGWHIECSAMIRKIFGKTIDIHTGGVDLIFPHHENEIAQSEAAYDEKFVRYWIHVEHLLVDGAKMSKSAGNFYTLRDLIEKGYSARSIRYLLISSHYRKQLNFTLEGLKQADHALERIDNLIVRLRDVKKGGDPSHEIEAMINLMLSEFGETVDNDLNISGGLGVFFDFVTKVNTLIAADKLTDRDASLILDAINRIDSVFGFIFFGEEEDVDAERIDALVEERIQARKNKDFKRSDEIRDTLKEEGIILEDTKDGTRWKRKK